MAWYAIVLAGGSGKFAWVSMPTEVLLSWMANPSFAGRSEAFRGWWKA